MREALHSTVDREQLRAAFRDEYALVARDPEHGFHFHTGRSRCCSVAVQSGSSTYGRPALRVPRGDR